MMQLAYINWFYNSFYSIIGSCFEIMLQLLLVQVQLEYLILMFLPIKKDKVYHRRHNKLTSTFNFSLIGEYFLLSKASSRIHKKQFENCKKLLELLYKKQLKF